MNPFELFELFDSFEWDSGNLEKNVVLHDVTPFECEEVFFNRPLLINFDQAHSLKEKRFFAMGKTDRNRLLFIGITLREKRLRVITARDMNKKEVRIYDEAQKRTARF